MLAGFGLELAGRAAARLAGTLGMPVHSSTVLRLVMALPDPPVTAAPEVTGVDDFALRKGRVYGTVMADAESGEVMDLLPDRRRARWQEWLKAHPGAEVICRDRAGAYAEGAAPARRPRSRSRTAGICGTTWPKTPRKRSSRTAAASRRSPAAAEPATPHGQRPAPPGRASPPDGLRHVPAASGPGDADPRTPRRRSTNCWKPGTPAAISRALGLDPDRQPVRPRASAAELLVKATSREQQAGPVQALHQPAVEPGHHRRRRRCTPSWPPPGWTGSAQAVRRYVRPFRSGPAAPPARPGRCPKTRQITRWLLSRPGSLDADDQAQLAAVTASCPHLDALAGHIRSFAEMMTRRQGLLALEDWLTAVEADDQPHLHSFASGIRRDQHAVTAGLALPYSSAAMEGNVNKIKMIKRQMYGRAGFALLRKRVILHPA